MDPISASVLVALAGGAGGEAGRQVWGALTGLVQRPFRRGEDDSPTAPGVSSAEPELIRLDQVPTDLSRANALSVALAVRAALDAEFSHELQQWWEQAKLVRTGDGEVTNTISGGTFNSQVNQGRDFSGFSYTQPPLPPTSATRQRED